MGGAQNPLSMNRFLYAHANPATLIDPTGHYAVYGDDICQSSIAAVSLRRRDTLGLRGARCRVPRPDQGERAP
jgi:hypothetical protein